MNRLFCALIVFSMFFAANTAEAGVFGCRSNRCAPKCCAPAPTTCCKPARAPRKRCCGLFSRRNRCCKPATTCCAPAPTCCAPAPTCCAPAPAPAPCCAAAPAPTCCAPAPTCCQPKCCPAPRRSCCKDRRASRRARRTARRCCKPQPTCC